MRAVEIHQRERRATDADLKSFLSEIETQWRMLAQSYRIAEQVSERTGQLRKRLGTAPPRRSAASRLDSRRRATHS
jgi:hypothetical protein